jgi:hypothetical protein
MSDFASIKEPVRVAVAVQGKSDNSGNYIKVRETGRGGTVPFSVLGTVARAVVRVIARTFPHTQNCPIVGQKWDSSFCTGANEGV